MKKLTALLLTFAMIIGMAPMMVTANDMEVSLIFVPEYSVESDGGTYTEDAAEEDETPYTGDEAPDEDDSLPEAEVYEPEAAPMPEAEVVPAYIGIMPLGLVDISVFTTRAQVQTGVQDAIDALAPGGGTVTVAGTLIASGGPYTGSVVINIPDNVIVQWDAHYSFGTSGSVVHLLGSGEFVLGSSGTIANIGGSGGGVALNISGPVTVRIAGGTVESTTLRPIEISGGGHLIVESGTVQTSHTSGDAIRIMNGTATIHDGTITASGAGGRAVVVVNGTAHINGGTLSGGGSAVHVNPGSNTANISGGTLHGGVTGTGTVNITGGTFVVHNADDLNAALTAIGTGTIRLGADVTRNTGISISGTTNITLETDGHTLLISPSLSVAISATGSSAFLLDDTDGGEVNVVSAIIIVSDDSTVEVSNVTGTSSPAVSANGANAVVNVRRHVHSPATTFPAIWATLGQITIGGNVTSYVNHIANPITPAILAQGGTIVIDGNVTSTTNGIQATSGGHVTVNGSMTAPGNYILFGTTDIRNQGGHNSFDTTHYIFTDGTITVRIARQVTPPAIGTGTASNPWQIVTPANWRWMKDYHDVAAGAGDMPIGAPAPNARYYQLMNNLDLTGLGNDAMVGVPPDDGFAGSLDGNGNTITVDIQIGASQSGRHGLFREIDADGLVENLVVAGVVHAPNAWNMDIGALAGANSGTIKNSRSTANVTGHHRTGGLVGINSGIVELSSASGNVTLVNGTSQVGGLVGSNIGTIRRSFATGNVSAGTSSGAGGLAGFNLINGTIEDSYATGNVTGNNNVGGLVGINSGSINRTYATGNITGAGDSVAGLVGSHSGSISQSVVLNGNIQGSSNTNRIWGWGSGGSSDINNWAHAYTQMNGAAFSGTALHNGQHGATGTAAEIATQAWWGNSRTDWTGWDLSPTGPWEWSSTHNLPILRNVPGVQNPQTPTALPSPITAQITAPQPNGGVAWNTTDESGDVTRNIVVTLPGRVGTAATVTASGTGVSGSATLAANVSGTTITVPVTVPGTRASDWTVTLTLTGDAAATSPNEARNTVTITAPATAPPTRTLTIDLHGGTGGAVFPADIPQTTWAIAPITPIPTRTGFDFNGWALSDGGAAVTDIPAGTTAITLHALWTALSSDNNITAFTIPGQVGATDITATDITVTMPHGTNVTALVPAIIHTGVSISPVSGAAQDFTNPVTYTVTAADSSTQVYTVTVNLAPPTPDLTPPRPSGRSNARFSNHLTPRPAPSPTPTPSPTPPDLPNVWVQPSPALTAELQQQLDTRFDDLEIIVTPSPATTPGGIVAVDVAFIIEETSLTNLTAHYTIFADLSGFIPDGQNHHRIVAEQDGEIIGGGINTRDMIFSVNTNNIGETEIAYIPTLKRLSLSLTSFTITDLAGNAPTQTMDIRPIIQDGRTLVPLRFIAEALGAAIDWEYAEADTPLTVVLTHNGQTLYIPIGEVTPQLAAQGMEIPAQIMDGRTMVP
ncbi:MAG: stalk domain-containing protein, partial [Defluviitaleaceae bacterium]|nr:stalk domain-containing protein [Defluviitaleaceae bacterium]